MDYNTDSARKSLTSPNIFGDSLKNDPKFRLTSPQTFLYNCIAFAMGMQDRWVDDANIPWHWWPPVLKDRSINSLIAAFQYFGFEECGLDDRIDGQYDKVALYKNNTGWTHAAKIIDNGLYHSKFGSSYDGQHSSGDVLKSCYGSVVVIMRRLKSDSHLTEDKKGIAPGVMHLNKGINIGGHLKHLVTYQGKTYLAEHGNEVIIAKNGLIRIL